jgi:hypothetical protein
VAAALLAAAFEPEILLAALTSLRTTSPAYTNTPRARVSTIIPRNRDTYDSREECAQPPALFIALLIERRALPLTNISLVLLTSNWIPWGSARGAYKFIAQRLSTIYVSLRNQFQPSKVHATLRILPIFMNCVSKHRATR